MKISDFENAAISVNSDFKCISTYSEKQGLKPNTTKTMALAVGSQRFSLFLLYFWKTKKFFDKKLLITFKKPEKF